MKKKLLSTVFALAIGATCTIGFTACGGDDDGKDAEIASKAINYIDAQYGKMAEETAETYTVNGVAPVDGENRTVNWSVAKGEGCTLNDISAYVSVGEMNDKKQVTVTIAKAEVEIPYVLTASVTVGKETKSVSYKHKVPAKSAGHAGTQADPYTPSNIRDIAATMNSKWDTSAADQNKAQSFYYPNNDTPTRVFVKGYVVSTGTQLFQDKSTSAQFIYLADEFGTGKKSDDADVIMLMSISYTTKDSLIKSAADINEGDCLTVSGFIQNYFKNSKADAQPEISRFKNTDNTYQETVCVARVEAVDNRTDAQKVDDALAKVNAWSVLKTGEAELPVSTEEDVTFTWALKSGTAATLSTDGKKLNVAALPAEDATVTLTVTAKCGSETKTKDVEVTVKKASEVIPGTTISLAFADKTNRTSFSKTEQVYSDNGITFTNLKGNSTTNCGDYVNPVRCYKNSTVKVECASISKIVFHSSAAYTDKDGKVSDYVNWLKTCCENSGVAGITVTISDNDVTVEFASAVTSFEIQATEGQLRIMSIDITT